MNNISLFAPNIALHFFLFYIFSVVI